MGGRLTKGRHGSPPPFLVGDERLPLRHGRVVDRLVHERLVKYPQSPKDRNVDASKRFGHLDRPGRSDPTQRTREELALGDGQTPCESVVAVDQMLHTSARDFDHDPTELERARHWCVNRSDPEYDHEELAERLFRREGRDMEHGHDAVEMLKVETAQEICREEA